MIRFLKYSSNNYRILRNNAAHNFAQNHALCLYRSDAIYSFIPKNACSTMRTSLAYANGCIQNKEDFNWIHQNNSTFVASLAELAKARYTFTILRCPFSRLSSVYLDKIINRDTVAWNYWDLTGRKADMDNLSFSEFVKSLQNDSILNGNIHWRPQGDFLVYRTYDDYFAMEDFRAAQHRLKDVIDLDIIDARDLTKHGIDRYKSVNRGNFAHTRPLELLNMKMSGKLPDPKRLYTDELIEIALKIYRKDFELYCDVLDSKNLMFRYNA